jgi:membrane protease YdiL (CAAX protease family)
MTFTTPATDNSTSSGTGIDASALSPRSGRLRWLLATHPVAAFCALAFPLGWTFLALRTAHIGSTAAGYAFPYLALLGSALLVTWAGGGRLAVLRFLSRYLIWRVGLRRWALIVLALPALTVAFAASTGTLHVSGHSWAYVAGALLVQTFITGALEVNLAEEGGWGGLVQTRFAQRSGLLGGALRTAPLFAAIHLPLQFTSGWTMGSVASGFVALLVIAPFFRYLIGETLEATGGSLLAAGILHASFNASGQLGFPGGWQFLPALLVLCLAIAVARRLRRPRTSHHLSEGALS